MLGGSDSGWHCCIYDTKCVQSKSLTDTQDLYKTLFPNDDFNSVDCKSQACSAIISKDGYNTCTVTSPDDDTKTRNAVFYYDQGYS